MTSGLLRAQDPKRPAAPAGRGRRSSGRAARRDQAQQAPRLRLSLAQRAQRIKRDLTRRSPVGDPTVRPDQGASTARHLARLNQLSRGASLPRPRGYRASFQTLTAATGCRGARSHPASDRSRAAAPGVLACLTSARSSSRSSSKRRAKPARVLDLARDQQAPRRRARTRRTRRSPLRDRPARARGRRPSRPSGCAWNTQSSRQLSAAAAPRAPAPCPARTPAPRRSTRPRTCSGAPGPVPGGCGCRQARRRSVPAHRRRR